jgi:diguanylate cyclase (GGDEF)-like protein
MSGVKQAGEPAILVVDDMRLYRRIAREQLEREGYRVTEAASGEEALDLVRKDPPHLVLLDMFMPGIDGVETCRRLRHEHRTRDVPIIFLSAQDDVSQVVAGLEAGASDYVTKPFSPLELLARIRAHMRIKQLQDERAQLYQFALAIQSVQTLQGAYDVIQSRMPTLLPGYGGVVLVSEGSPPLMEPRTSWGDIPDYALKPISMSSCRAFQYGARYLSTDPVGPHCDHLPADDAADSMCISLMMHGEPLGLLHLRHYEPSFAPLGESSDEAFRQRVEAAAVHIAINLGNLRLRDTLRSQSIRDPLTGLFNRRYLEESMIRELSRATREQYPVGVIMLDLDYFKRINDSWGHEAGDAVLRDVGSVLRNGIRTGDIACRYGGEEFLAILPGVELNVTLQRAEQLLEKIRSLRVQHLGVDMGSITASLGVAAYPEHGDDCDALLRAADSALYESKQAGRDRVTVAMTLGERVEKAPSAD